MMKTDVSFYIHVNGKPVTEYIDPATGNIYIEGRKGSAYELVMRNFTGTRKKVVLSVDGLNVMTGDSTWDRGYVLNPWETLIVPGWRIDSGSVAAFRFSEAFQSYNARNDAGDGRNIGVIGCMVYDEKPPQIVWNYNPVYTFDPNAYLYPNSFKYDYSTTIWNNTGAIGATFDSAVPSMGASNSVGSPHRSTSKSFQASVEPFDFNEEMARSVEPPVAVAMAAAAPSMGTDWGETQNFQTKTVNYDFNPNSVHTLAIYYDSRLNLQRRGIRLDSPHRSDPNPFPGRDGCPFPK